MRIWSLAHCKLHFPAVTWKILSDHFQGPCDAINTFQDKLPALLSSFFGMFVSTRTPSVFFGGRESYACFRNNIPFFPIFKLFSMVK